MFKDNLCWVFVILLKVKVCDDICGKVYNFV